MEIKDIKRNVLTRFKEHIIIPNSTMTPEEANAILWLAEWVVDYTIYLTKDKDNYIYE